MLGRKAKIELKEELSNITTQLDALESRQKMIIEKSGDMLTEIDAAEIAADAQDRELNSVVNSAKEIKDMAEESAEKAGLLSDAEESLRTIIKEREEFNDGMKQRAETEKELLYALMDESKHSSGIAKTLREASESFETKAGSILTDIDKLAEFSGSISEMSLNAAMKAGRMGESGMDFVRAAEEIRSYSEEFEDFVSKARDNVTELKRSFRETQDSMVALLDIMRNTSHSLTKIVSAVDEDNEAVKGERKIDPVRDLKDIKETAEVFLETQNGILEEQKQIMDHIEKIGTHYIEENQNIAKIKEILKEINPENTVIPSEGEEEITKGEN
ncbi:MAG: hypothetical protein IIZ61_07870 [Lachnospiraceae bacterium]|nr:hypothetical protein [Lachnospiraceae bacterium]